VIEIRSSRSAPTIVSKWRSLAPNFGTARSRGCKFKMKAPIGLDAAWQASLGRRGGASGVTVAARIIIAALWKHNVGTRSPTYRNMTIRIGITVRRVQLTSFPYASAGSQPPSGVLLQKFTTA
jgi:hypothetical protein